MDNAPEILRMCVFLSFILIIVDYFKKKPIHFNIMRVCYLLCLCGCVINGSIGDIVIGFLVVMSYLERKKNNLNVKEYHNYKSY